MGKISIFIAFGIIFGGGVYIFITKSSTSRDRHELVNKSGESTPRMYVQGIRIRKYSINEVLSEFSAREAEFWEPNRIEIRGDLRGMRVKEGFREEIQGNSGEAILEADTLHDVFKKSEIRSVAITGDVKLTSRNHTLMTDTANYNAADNILSSDEKVTVLGHNRLMIGEQGFRYDLNKETLQIIGKVSGYFVHDQGKK